MNNPVIRGVLHVLKKIARGLIRLVLFVIAWCFKLSSRIADKIGDEILKLSEK